MQRPVLKDLMKSMSEPLGHLVYITQEGLSYSIRACELCVRSSVAVYNEKI